MLEGIDVDGICVGIVDVKVDGASDGISGCDVVAGLDGSSDGKFVDGFSD